MLKQVVFPALDFQPEIMGIESSSRDQMSSRVCRITPWQTPSQVLARLLPGSIPVTQRRSPRLAGRLHARLLSPLLVWINQQRLAP